MSWYSCSHRVVIVRIEKRSGQDRLEQEYGVGGEGRNGYTEFMIVDFQALGWKMEGHVRQAACIPERRLKFIS